MTRRWFAAAVVALGLALLCGCPASGPSTSGPSRQPSAGATADSSRSSAGKKYQIAVIPKGTTHVFWKSVHAGAENAARELGNVQVFWKGPILENDTDGQISVVQDFITKQVDGIVLAPNDSQSLVASVQQAKEAGIPTVIFDSGLDDEETIVSYVATDNYRGGVLAAERLGEVLGGKGGVIMMRYKQGSESTEQREKGFLETLEKEFPGIDVLSSNQYSGTTPESSLDVAQQLLTKYGDEVDGAFAVCEPNGAGMLGALEAQELAGKVTFIGFDPSEVLIDAMRAGKLHGIVLQDPVKMGYLGVKTMVAHLEGQPVEKRIATGEYIATPENMDTPEMAKLLNPEQY
jgi:ribose transport system substrate-binding protein